MVGDQRLQETKSPNWIVFPETRCRCSMLQDTSGGPHEAIYAGPHASPSNTASLAMVR
jgi:hypothetical protein